MDIMIWISMLMTLLGILGILFVVLGILNRKIKDLEENGDKYLVIDLGRKGIKVRTEEER